VGGFVAAGYRHVILGRTADINSGAEWVSIDLLFSVLIVDYRRLL
jgi:hypothetical protein